MGGIKTLPCESHTSYLARISQSKSLYYLQGRISNTPSFADAIDAFLYCLICREKLREACVARPPKSKSAKAETRKAV